MEDGVESLRLDSYGPEFGATADKRNDGRLEDRLFSKKTRRESN